MDIFTTIVLGFILLIFLVMVVGVAMGLIKWLTTDKNGIVVATIILVGTLVYYLGLLGKELLGIL